MFRGVCDMQAPPRERCSWVIVSSHWMNTTKHCFLSRLLHHNRKMNLLPENLTFDSMPPHTHQWSLPISVLLQPLVTTQPLLSFAYFGYFT